MTAELPDRYGRTELVLMVVDPFLLFAYWEVTPEGLGQAQDALGAEMAGARAVLRFYDISLVHFDGTNAHHTFDIDIGSKPAAGTSISGPRRNPIARTWGSWPAPAGSTRSPARTSCTRLARTCRPGTRSAGCVCGSPAGGSPTPRGRWSPSPPHPSVGGSLPRSFAPFRSAACANRRDSRPNSPRGHHQAQCPRVHDDHPTDRVSLSRPALPPPVRPASRTRALPGGE